MPRSHRVLLLLALSGAACDSRDSRSSEVKVVEEDAWQVPAPPTNSFQQLDQAAIGPDELAVLTKAVSGEIMPATTAEDSVSRRLLPADVLREIVRLLAAQGSYQSEQEDWLPIGPVFTVRFGDGTRFADFNFDFDYNLLSAAPGYQDYSPNMTLGKAANFTPIRSQLVRLLQGAYPENAKIRHLADKSDRIRRHLRPDVREVLESPGKVEAFRITSSHSRRREYQREFTDPWAPTVRWFDRAGIDLRDPLRTASRASADARMDSEPRLGSHVILDTSPEPTPAFAREITEGLLDDQTYAIRGPIMCFEPGLAFRYRRSNQSVTLLVCLHCSKVVPVYEGFDEPKPENVFGSLSEIGRDRLRALGQQAFPHDPAFQPSTEKLSRR